MRLHKMVNGKKVMLTDDEEAELRSEWTKAREEHEIKRKNDKRNKETRKLMRSKLAKLMQVTEEEVGLLFYKGEE